MARWFHRCATLLALVAVFAFTLHLEPGHHPLTDEAGHHCCLCHTAGIASSSVAMAYRPPIQTSAFLPIYKERRSEVRGAFCDGWRGPPEA